MTRKENYFRTVRFERPDFIPMSIYINDACWQSYPQEFLAEEIVKHPRLFEGYQVPTLPYFPEFSYTARKNVPYTDSFGCVWKTTVDGITGTVTGHPLEDWDAFRTYQAPDPDLCDGLGPVDWQAFKKSAQDTPDDLHLFGLRHGHTFLQLCDLRGYENLICDMNDEDPYLPALIDLVEQFNLGVIKHLLDCGAEAMGYAEDLGMQVGPMISPEHFRRYIKPSYKKIIAPAKEKGLPIHMHSDGDIRMLAGELVDGGVEILNLQDLVNGIDWIHDTFTGRLCIDLDIDRQKITRFGTPKDVAELIHREVTTLGSRQGGLMMVYGLYPGIPLQNIQALWDAMEAHMGYFD